MSENSEKCRSGSLKTSDDVLICLVSSTNQRYSVYSHTGGKKAANIEFCHFFLHKNGKPTQTN